MTERKIIIEHNGETLYGHIATIKSTRLTYEDHGILSHWLSLEWKSAGIGFGGYCLDEPKERGGKDLTRVGTAYGLDYLIRVMETVGVETYEKLTGAQVIILFDSENSWGSTARGIAGLQNDKVFIPKTHAEIWLAKA